MALTTSALSFLISALSSSAPPELLKSPMITASFAMRRMLCSRRWPRTVEMHAGGRALADVQILEVQRAFVERWKERRVGEAPCFRGVSCGKGRGWIFSQQDRVEAASRRATCRSGTSSVRSLWPEGSPRQIRRQGPIGTGRSARSRGGLAVGQAWRVLESPVRPRALVHRHRHRLCHRYRRQRYLAVRLAIAGIDWRAGTPFGAFGTIQRPFLTAWGFRGIR